MKKWVVDTNVAIVANGRNANASAKCQLSALKALKDLLGSGKIIIDDAGEMLSEYKRYLNPRGQPGVGDVFFREILMNYEKKIERVFLPRRPNGEYEDFPADPRLKRFDLSDRKFAAASRRCVAPVLNATDSDWLEHRAALMDCGVHVVFVCGIDTESWFEGHVR